ncbi:hypothetical protein [Poseidonibacter lekithochrous]|uniref:hypothetical protein n=1 Tax=Poseidonibacter lekithochrous TaxID=1904463 RepID=UPI000A4CFF0C|nr:hypothetical protein [Poseidonibacter lekithochrous]QKJ24109.1 hypothetical protein ALEK_2886 [Poseidonibacter lekithochrous]
MKKILKVTLAATVAFSLSSFLNASEVSKLDVKKTCDVKANGIKNVIATADKYNAMAKKQGLEFMRLGMKTSQYISGVNSALKTGSKTVDILNKKKKKTGTVTVDYAAWRACSFAIRALQQNEEAKTAWSLAVPGDGYKY